MYIRIGFEIVLDCAENTAVLLALSPHSTYANKVIGSDQLRAEPPVPLEEYVDEFGNRRTRFVSPGGRVTLTSDFIVEDSGEPDPVHPDARQLDIAELPPETLTYLTASRYCEVDELGDKAWQLFGNLEPGWPRVQAICDWVHNHLTFGYQFGRPTKTANHALLERTGVCRDFAQLAIGMCRAMNIPARYASGYLGDIGVPPSGPGDFCAWFEVFLEDRWHTFDARYNTPRIGRVLMVRGRDAADVAMITAFGEYELKLFRVWCDEIPGIQSEEALERLLNGLPDAPSLLSVA